MAQATRQDGTSAVLKVLMPGAGNDASNEATVLLLVPTGTDVRSSTNTTQCGAPYSWNGWDGLCMSSAYRSHADLRFSVLLQRSYGDRRQIPGCLPCREGPVARRLHRDVVGGTRSPMLRKGGRPSPCLCPPARKGASRREGRVSARRSAINRTCSRATAASSWSIPTACLPKQSTTWASSCVETPSNCYPATPWTGPIG